MKREIKTGNKKARAIRISVAKRSSANNVTLKIELLPVRKIRRRKANRKNKARFNSNAKDLKRFTARPVIGYMNISQKIKVGRRVYVHMMNNTDFADAAPSPYFLYVVTDALDEAYYDALHGDESERKMLGSAERDFDSIYAAVVQYVDKKANGSEQVYRSAGIEPVLTYSRAKHGFK